MRVHCWEGSVEGEGTCMLPDGHDGDHLFTPDDEILICFPESKELGE